MKLTPSSTARRRTAIASVRFLGGPQMPSPVRRIAPNPRRCTETSPPSETIPANLADISFAFIISSRIRFFLLLPVLWVAAYVQREGEASEDYFFRARVRMYATRS